MENNFETMETPTRELDFNQILTLKVKQEQVELAHAVIEAFKQGDSNAIKLVMQNLIDARGTEEQQLPITDDRFKEIICLVADAFRAGEI